MYKSYLLQNCILGTASKWTRIMKYFVKILGIWLDFMVEIKLDSGFNWLQVHLWPEIFIGTNLYLEHVASVILSVRWNILRGYIRRNSQILSLPLIVTNQLILICASIIYYILCQIVTSTTFTLSPSLTSLDLTLRWPLVTLVKCHTAYVKSFHHILVPAYGLIFYMCFTY